MAEGTTGENLVFLVSQPRAGSTLLQRTLGRHPRIVTRSETWLMLAPLYVLRESGWSAEYGSATGVRALEEFLSALPRGRDDYVEGVRRMYGYLYGQALGERADGLLLDKTPRYHLILPELAEVFPDAAFIVLLRHPAAVLDSVRRAPSFGRDRQVRLHRHRIDLLDGPGHLAAALDRPPRRLSAVRFEELVRAPRPVLESLCDRLRIDFSGQLLDWTESARDSWQLGERGTRPLSSPDPAAADRWTEALADAQSWRDSRDYLELLGDEVVERLGYSASDWRARLAAHRPSWLRRARTRSLERALA